MEPWSGWLLLLIGLSFALMSAKHFYRASNEERWLFRQHELTDAALLGVLAVLIYVIAFFLFPRQLLQFGMALALAAILVAAAIKWIKDSYRLVQPTETVDTSETFCQDKGL